MKYAVELYFDKKLESEVEALARTVAAVGPVKTTFPVEQCRQLKKKYISIY